MPITLWYIFICYNLIFMEIKMNLPDKQSLEEQIESLFQLYMSK